MTIKFDIDKFVTHLERYKSDLPILYNWNAKIDRLVELEQKYLGLTVRLDEEGTAYWSIATEKSIGKKLAFILNNRLVVNY